MKREDYMEDFQDDIEERMFSQLAELEGECEYSATGKHNWCMCSGRRECHDCSKPDYSWDGDDDSDN